MSTYAGCYGGYGELELPFFNHELHEKAVVLQSARAALFLFLNSVKAEVIYIPNYICDSIYPALNELAIKIKKYEVDEFLNPCFSSILKPTEYLLLVNYFGVCRGNIESFINESAIKQENIIIDNSQALFEVASNVAATIYSPRKFLGIPDGGFLYTKERLKEVVDKYDAERLCSHLLLRSANETQSGYEYFLKAEVGLDDFFPKKISSISSRLIKSYNFAQLKFVRQRNFAFLEKFFSDVNNCNFAIACDEVPLCYPLKLSLNVDKICEQLKENNIFLPRYWPNCVNNSWYSSVLFLPIDHRISKEDLGCLATKVKELIK